MAGGGRWWLGNGAGRVRWWLTLILIDLSNLLNKKLSSQDILP